MKRIALAVFAITGVLAAGFFATSAYFTDTITQNNYTFVTDSPDLKFGFCPGISTDCIPTAATLDTIDFDITSPLSDVHVGPGKSGSDCLVIENTGSYLLHLTSKFTVLSESVVVANPHGLQDAFLVKAATADSSCNPPGTAVYSLQSARSAEAAGNVSVGDLAPGARMYVIISNAWDSSWDQTALQNAKLKLNTSVTGKTD